jgi:SagB-type dehydrogenase family enzyme
MVAARTMGHTFRSDAELQLPVRPCLIPELLVCPIGEDGVLFAGAHDRQVLRGRSARGVLRRILPLLDGSRTLAELRSSLPDLRAQALADVVSLLFSRGLIEDGRVQLPNVPAYSEMASFLGRHNDVTRRHRNRSEALQQLQDTFFRVLGPARLVELVHEQLAEAGVTQAWGAHEGPERCDLLIAISTGRQRLDMAELKTAVAGSERALLARMGEREAHLGPRLITGTTICTSCLERIHPHPSGEPGPLLVELWLGLIVQRALLDVAGVSPSRLYSRLDQFTLTERGRLAQRARIAPRMPGCADCGIPGPSWSPDDPRLLGWLLHESSSILRRHDVAPKDHQSQYLVVNQKLGAERRTLLYGARTLGLPDAVPLVQSVPWSLRAAVPRATSLDLAHLATLLARTAGEVSAGGHRRRIAPTGGNLGSVRLWVLAREVDGLGAGAYLYDPDTHSLAFRGGFDEVALHRALGSHAALPACIVLGTGDLAKCSRKYQSFAYRLIHCDAGIALTYAHLIADNLGLSLCEYPNADPRVPELLRVPLRMEAPQLTFALGLGAHRNNTEAGPTTDVGAQSPGSAALLTHDDYTPDLLPRMLSAALDGRPPAVRQPLRGVRARPVVEPNIVALEDVLQRRRATREFSSKPPAGEVLEAITLIAFQGSVAREAAGAPQDLVRPLMSAPTDVGNLEAGLYELDPLGRELLWRRASLDRGQFQECINQHSLGQSAASLVAVSNLRTALTVRGSRGYAETAISAGALIGTAWLAATSYGLMGTAAGGVITSGFRECGRLDGFNECPILAFHFGLERDRD